MKNLDLPWSFIDDDEGDRILSKSGNEILTGNCYSSISIEKDHLKHLLASVNNHNILKNSLAESNEVLDFIAGSLEDLNFIPDSSVIINIIKMTITKNRKILSEAIKGEK